MITLYYTYSEATKRLSRADDPATIDGRKVVHPSAAMYARMKPPAYPLADPMPPAPTSPEGKVAVFDGYETVDGHWVQKWRYGDAPAPTLVDFDAAMEGHLRAEREARGYTTREPDAYLTSAVPRWKQDAEDWVAHRDAVMGYALALINAVQAGEREPPTMAEFKAGLPQIEWTVETTETPGTAGTAS